MYRTSSCIALLLLVGLPMPPAHADYALAFGRKGKSWSYGSSRDAPSLEAAKKNALAHCDKRSCKVVASGRNQCVALAVSANGGAGWASDPELSSAREQALVACSEVDRRCVIKTSFCDTGSAPAPEETVLIPVAPAPPPITPKWTETPDRFATALKAQLRSCLNLSGASYGAQDTVKLVLGFDEAGKLAFTPTISAVGSGANSAAFATRLTVAINRCAPYGALPGVAAAAWKNVTIDFSPADFR